MQKKNASLMLVGTIAVSAFANGASANDMESSASSPTSMTQYQDTAYWEARKIEMQKKSSEMRAKKVAELKEKGIDVSSITPDLLDASKTDEGKFWEAVKKIMNAHEIEARRAFLEKLKAQGIDVSSITEDVIADGGKFWTAVKALRKPATEPRKTGEGDASGPFGSELKSYLRTDLTPEDFKALGQLFADLGKTMGAILNDSSITVDEKVAKIVELHKANSEILATKYVDPAKIDDFRKSTEEKLAKMTEYIRKSLLAGTSVPMDNSRAQNEGERKKNKPNRTGSGMTENREPRWGQQANPLSPKLRKTLETKLRAIPDDKKDEFYQRAKTVLAAQIAKAKEANKPKLVAKLEAVMAIVEDVLGPTDTEDTGIIDSIFNSGSTAQ